MRTANFAGVAVEHDELKTSELDLGLHDWCQCEGCNCARMARLDASPLEQTKLLRSLGLDPLYPSLSAWTNRRGRKNSRYGQRLNCWIVSGKVLGATHTPLLRFDAFNSMWVDSRREALNAQIDNLDAIELDDPGLIYVVTSNRLLWLPGEVCSFRQDYSAMPCPECGSLWRETGYLKRRSLIPDWKGVPHLKAILRAREKRVYVEFCWQCGRMEYKLVEDKPPFRTKNHQLRDMRRARMRRPLP